MSNDSSPGVVFLNGTFLPANEAKISIMDRGLLFADSVYEVAGVVDGRKVDNSAHIERLKRSLALLSIPCPYTSGQWSDLQDEIIRKNHLSEGTIYIQVTRGTQMERSPLYHLDTPPTVFIFTQQKPIVSHPGYESGINVVSLPDHRWARRDIKSNMLLTQVLARQEAFMRNAQEAWLVQDGFVTEGAASSAFIVTKGNELVTRPLSQAILPGITRATLLSVAEMTGVRLSQRLFTLAEAHNAKEAFISSVSEIALPVVCLDEKAIGDGKPGPIAAALRQAYFDAVI